MAEDSPESSSLNLKPRRRKLAILSILLLATAAAIACLTLRQPDVYHTKERRAAKEAMIKAITADLGTKTPPARPADDDWMDQTVIFCADGSWLAYRSQCHKQDPKVWDLFIAKASDGKWYYSTYHFCIDAIVLRSSEQPESLARFKADYSLAEFDGKSDLALEQTWPIK